MRKIIRFIRNIIFIAFILAIVAAFLFHNQILDYGKSKASKTVAKALVESDFTSQLDSNTGGAVSKASDVYDQMDKQDQEKVENIIEKNMTKENLAAAKNYILNKDTQGLEDFAKSKLSAQDQQTVEDLYDKYKDKLQ